MSTAVATNTPSTATSTPAPAPASDIVGKAEPNTTTDAGDKESTSIYNYIFVGVLAVALICLLYYAYCRFSENSTAEPFTKGTAQERDDPVIDFNLREAIKELQNTQRQIMKTISENSEL
mgnify:CR=1 FL=1